MRLIGLAAALSASVLAVPAFAQDAAPADAAPPPAAPASPAGSPPVFSVSGGATAVSDYRFRGISQTNKHFAIQGTFTVAHASGFYVSTWGSSIDDYVANGSDQEIDLIAGYKKTIKNWTVDGGLLYYFYPGNGNANTDFAEPYLSVSTTLGPVGAKFGGNYAWDQRAQACDAINPSCSAGKKDNLYLYGELSGAVPKTGVTLTGHVGHDFGRSYLSGGYKGYWDWNLNASYTWNHLTFGITYVDTDVKRRDTAFQFQGTNLGGAGVVGSIGVGF